MKIIIINIIIIMSIGQHLFIDQVVTRPTDSMNQIIAWEVDSLSSGQEILRLLYKPKSYSNPPLDPILNQLKPVHTLFL